jgi:metal-responsive CopG/Arc/MetJ family transcriptional regulator
VKTAVSIPAPLFKRADRLAKRMKTSRSELYARALEAFVKEHESSDVTKKLNEVYGATPSTMDPTLAAMMWASLPREEW